MAFNRYPISRSNLYSLCEVVGGYKAMLSELNKKEFAKVRISLKQATKACGLEWDHAYL